MKILDFDSQVFLAPMAGITDQPFRSLVASLGGGVIVSEMVAINAISRKNPKSYKIADVKDEPYPVVVQLVGSDADLFAEASKLVADLGAYSLDINMGCPVKKIVNNQSGSALMKDMLNASKIIKSVVAATPLKVSVKFRKGWDNSCVNAVEFAKMCEESGAAYITLHGRTRSEFYSGEADWDIIAAAKDAVKIPLIGNGDVTDVFRAKEMLDYTKADAVMVGRAALGAPWLIRDIDNYLKNGSLPQEMSPQEIKSMLLYHIRQLVEYYGERTALPLSRKYVCWYCKGLYDAKRFREQYNKITDFAQSLQAVEQYFSGC